MTRSVLIRHGYVVTMDAKEHIFRDGAVLVEDGVITFVGSDDAAPSGAEETVDARSCIVIPGLIDTHVHLAQALLRGLVPDNVRLIPWLRDWVWPLQGVYDASDGRASANLCITEMLKSGTTCFLESLIHTRYGFDGIAEAVKSSGIRGVLSKSVMDLPGYATQSTIMSPGMIEQKDATLREFKEMHGKWNNKAEGRILVWLGLRTPGACTTDLYREVAHIRGEFGSGITMHLAEVREDLEYFGGLTTSPSGFLEQLGLLGGRHVYAHCVWLDAKDMEKFAATGTSVAHCPSSNLKLGSGVAPICEMIRKRVNVTLGCDGGPSNDCYDLLRETKLAALLQKGTLQDASCITAIDVMKMATANGARALGLDHKIGSIVPGKRGDIVIVSLKGPNLLPALNPLNNLVYSASGANIRDVLVDGQIVVREGELLTINEDKVREDAKKHSALILDRSGLRDTLEKDYPLTVE